ncbi:MAG TPA: caspase family protein [Puia sp.]|nr:caspase family protein [Puia sp.]
MENNDMPARASNGIAYPLRKKIFESLFSKKTISVIIFLVCCIPGFTQPATVSRYALIFAIGDYPEAGGWPKISSLQDVSYIQNILQNQGFLPGNINIVADKNATISGIENAFEELIKKVNSGDIVVIHFSSHGERVEADNNNKIDGLDECVVTYNAISPLKSKNYQKDQAEYLRGHVLGGYLKRLRIKLGGSGDVIVFMDNCYSGGGTRGVSVKRGGEIPFVSATFNPRKHNQSDSSFLYKEEIISNDDEKKMASYEVFSATMPNEPDYETMDETTNTPVGSLTYAIAKSFENLRLGSTYPTYRALFANIQAIMNVKVPDQHPLLEGNGNDRVIFGKEFKYQMPYVEIASIDKSTNQVIIKAGELAGLSEGADIAIYPAGTSDTAKTVALARGKIYKSANFSSSAILNNSLSIKTPAEGWAFITARSYHINPIGLKIVQSRSKNPDDAFSPKDIATIKKYLSGLSFVHFTDNPEMILVRGRNADSLKTANGYLFSAVKNMVDDSLMVIDKLESYARYKFLQTLHSQVNGVAVEIELVPLVNGKPDTVEMKKSIRNNVFVAYESERLTLKIKNTGTRDAYVNILDMQPDGVINPVLPNSRLPYPIYAHDLKILAGAEYFLPREDFINVSPPYGTEVFKIIASEKEINLENISTTKGGSRGGMMTTMEKLIGSSYGLSRGASTSGNSDADATTADFIFLIKPRQKDQAQN